VQITILRTVVKIGKIWEKESSGGGGIQGSVTLFIQGYKNEVLYFKLRPLKRHGLQQIFSSRANVTQESKCKITNRLL